MAQLIDAITAIRNIRGESQLPPSKQFDAELHAPEAVLDVLRPNTVHIERLGNVRVTLRPTGSQKPPQAATSIVGALEAVVSLVGLIDWSKERERLARDKTKLAGELDKVEKKLQNRAFTDKAPPSVVEEQQSRRSELKMQLEKLDKSLAEIPG